ncbi:hypothetical protein F5X96DRAFT_640951 [Biscogniauxia mediterranea]|nr:hypothetical protein F5X96DRAFT_640951 [Biscogniauxia mediterranea]
MTPHLHPRSRMTSSLFATTLAASFLVVGLPHILPCPAPRVSYADSPFEVSPDGTRRRRRRRRPEPESPAQEVKDGIVQFSSSEEEDVVSRLSPSSSSDDSSTPRRRERECPVPKPGGVIGELMGFRNRKGANGDGDGHGDGGGGGNDGDDRQSKNKNKLVAAVVAPRPDGRRVDVKGGGGPEE